VNKKHILVIGGTRGTGAALVKIFAEENCVLSVIGRHSPFKKTNSTPNIYYWSADISHKKSILKTLNSIILKNGKLDSLIFFQRYRGKGDDWSGELATSLTATKDVIGYLTHRFKKNGDRSIVIVSSIAGQYIAQEQPLSYHVAKAGIENMARFYAVILGPKDIRVNSISYGVIIKEESGDFYLSNKKIYNLYKSITPLRRMAKSEDIVKVIRFLCSRDSSFITGQNIVVDGGVSLQSHETLARSLMSLKNSDIVPKSRRRQR